MKFLEGGVGRLIEPGTIRLRGSNTISESIETLRTLAQQHQLVYADVDINELLLADTTDRIKAAMMIEAFYFTALTPIEDAMRAVLFAISPCIRSAMNPKSDSALFAVTLCLNNSSTN
jgi:Mg/Co/Ni transporter MgtE